MDKVEMRRRSIITLLEQAPMVSVTEMAAHFQVTTETIRKDLEELERQGMIVKIRGGAALAKHRRSPYSLRKTKNQADKQNIAREACRLISRGSTLILEGSTTVEALCRTLLKEPELLKTLTIITNSIYVAELFMMGEACKRLFLTGGWVNEEEHVTQGLLAIRYLEHLHADMAFLSGAALNRKFQLAAYFEHDMLFQQAAIDCADQTVLLYSKSEYDDSGLYKVSKLDAIDFLVTSIPFHEQEKAVLRDMRVELIFAGE